MKEIILNVLLDRFWVPFWNPESYLSQLPVLKIWKNFIFDRSFSSLQTLQDRGEELKTVLEILQKGFSFLLEGDFKKAEEQYLQAEKILESKITLQKGDLKKWSDLTLFQKTDRIFFNYSLEINKAFFNSSNSERDCFLLEFQFRKFHLLRYLEKIFCFLEGREWSSALSFVRHFHEELRHFFSLFFGTKFPSLIEEAETVALANGVCFFDSLQKTVEDKIKIHTDFLKPIHHAFESVFQSDTKNLFLSQFVTEKFERNFTFKLENSSPFVSMPALFFQKKESIISSSPKVIIIGGGPAGIASGAYLKGNNFSDFLIFERSHLNSTITDLWSREKEADTFYGGPPPLIEGWIGMEDTNRAVFLARLKSFVDYFQLPIHENEMVKNICSDENKWKVLTNKGEYQSDYLILAAGRYGKPKKLIWEENGSKEIQTSIVRGVEIDQIQRSSVLVVGGGNSAFDAVKSLIANGTGSKQNKVFLSYPKKPFNVPASLHAHNNDQLLHWESEGKLTILWQTNPESVVFVSETGKCKVQFREESQPPLEVDRITPAVGWQMDREILENLGVHFIEGKGPDYDPSTGHVFTQNNQGERTRVPRLWVVGDYAIQKSVPHVFTSSWRGVKSLLKEIESTASKTITKI